MFKSQSGFVQYLLLVLLLIGIGVGVYLVQFTQIFKPKASSTQIEFFVSPSGQDSNDGTYNAPFKTLDKAKQAVREVNKSMSTGITVWLRGGVHELSSPFILEPDDSGFNGQYVVYHGYPGETAIISGGKRITGWTQEGDKWKAPSQGINTRQLYVSGKRAVRARTPGPLPNVQLTQAGYSTSATSLASFRNKSDIEAISKDYYRHHRCQVQDITGGNITMKEPCFTTAKVNFSTIKTPDWFENAFEFLDQPGEWYLDKTAQTFFYKPNPGEDMNSSYVIAPVLENLLIGKGTPENPIHNLAFQELRFEYSTWNEPTLIGYVGGQSNIYLTSTTPFVFLHPAGITFGAAKNIILHSDIFQHLGSGGVHFNYGSQDNIIKGNVFTDISADAIAVGDYDQHLIPSTRSGCLKS